MTTPPPTNVPRSPAEAVLFDELESVKATIAAAKAGGDLETASQLRGDVGKLSAAIREMRAKGEGG